MHSKLAYVAAEFEEQLRGDFTGFSKILPVVFSNTTKYFTTLQVILVLSQSVKPINIIQPLCSQNWLHLPQPMTDLTNAPPGHRTMTHIKRTLMGYD